MATWGGKGLVLLTIYSLSFREIRVGTEVGNLQTGTEAEIWNNAIRCLALSGLLGLLLTAIRTTCPHWLDSAIPILNQGNKLHVFRLANLVKAFSQLRVPVPKRL